MPTEALAGTLHSLNASAGGVPKLPRPTARVDTEGLDTDSQAHPAFHGGPERALCLLGLDVIERLAAEGHPIAPGTTGENLTVAGVPWELVGPGGRFTFAGGVQLEVVSFASPCRTISASFSDGDVSRLSADLHPGQARVYARVLTAGALRQGESCTFRPAPGARPG